MLLEGLREPFAATLARLHELALLRAIAEGAAGEGSGWLVLVGHEGVVAWTSAAASEGLALLAGERLPAAALPLGSRTSARGRRDSPRPGSDGCSLRGRAARSGSPLAARHACACAPRLVRDAYPGSTRCT